MKQRDAVIKVMEGKGGYTTLGLLYQEALNVPGVTWKTKTPFASIRRIIQDDKQVKVIEYKHFIPGVKFNCESASSMGYH
ncbi:hypothetical protein CVT91_08710 [Candidatus Atribacteria bacterium HGW-Atribacteria-1]|nr:MAG: hypothetical protein CVT91_08710 [Candidatus Atribacteria bacterium HGW-Atribacteria-1]